MCRVSTLLLLLILSPIIGYSAVYAETPFEVIKTETDPETGVIFNLKKSYDMHALRTNIRREVNPCVHGPLHVLVNVPKKINLADDTIAKAILEKARKYIFRACDQTYLHSHISNSIYLYNSEFNEGNWEKIWIVRASISGNISEKNLTQYFNKPSEESKAKRIAEEERKQKAAQEARLEEQRRQAAEQARLQMEQARLQEEGRRREAERRQMEIENQKVGSRNKFETFSKKNDVQHWPKSDEFQANPFVYEREIIGMKMIFTEMMSATKGVFQSSSNDYLIVSNIPKGFFTKVSDVILAGRFIGKESIKLPVFGDVSIPHLEFVDAHICKNHACDELLFWTQ